MRDEVLCPRCQSHYTYQSCDEWVCIVCEYAWDEECPFNQSPLREHLHMS